MRKVAITLTLVAAGAVNAAGAADAVSVTNAVSTARALAGGGVVHLDERTLEELRTSNPSHYARAQKILAAANHLCQPTAGEVEYAKLGAKDGSCLYDLVRTSNPPKRQISFRLDATQYVALVVLTDDPPRLVQALPER